jgi:multiple sugar transport system permease protein
MRIGMMMAVATLALLPVLLIFFFCQKYFVEGIKMSGLKA